MDTKKIMATFAILMIALGIAGFAYAHWNATITINGTVKTGKLHLYPTFTAEHNGWKDYNNNGVRDAGEDVMTLTSEIKDNTLTVKIENAYPCVTIKGKFDLHNDGTIPAGLYKWVISVSGVGSFTIFDANDIEHSVIKPSMTEEQVEAALKEFVEKAATGPAGKAVTISLDFAGSNFWQIDPGDEPKVNFELHFEEDLLQGFTAEFTMTLEYWNWNEVGYLR